MSANPPIRVCLDANESRRARAKKVKAAVLSDNHFLLDRPRKCPFDLRFQCGDMAINVELKDFTGAYGPQSDYVSSIVSPSGHLYQQVLKGRELEEPLIIAVLGDDTRVVQAITSMVYNRGIIGQVAEDKILNYIAMVEDFEANCIGMNIQVWHLMIDPWRRMLLNVRKMLQGGDLTAFRPRPAVRERQAIGLSILVGRGLGPARSRRILEKFHVTLVAKEPGVFLEDCSGIGHKMSKVVRDALFVPPNERA